MDQPHHDPVGSDPAGGGPVGGDPAGRSPASLTRRTGLAAGALAACAGAVGLPAAAHAMGDPAPRKDRPDRRDAAAAPGWRPGGPHPHPWSRRGSAKTLHEAEPADVGLDPEVLEQFPGILRAGLDNDPPRFAGATLLVASQRGIAYEHSDGYALRWQDASTELPEAERIQIGRAHV